MTLLCAEVRERPDEGEWWPVDAMEAAGLPTLYARAAALGRASTEMLAL